MLDLGRKTTRSTGTRTHSRTTIRHVYFFHLVLPSPCQSSLTFLQFLCHRPQKSVTIILSNGKPTCTRARRVARRPADRCRNLCGPNLDRWVLRLCSSWFACLPCPNLANTKSLLDSGHAGAMLQARRLGKELLVGIHSDKDIMDNKGPTVMTLKERLVPLRITSRR